MIVEIAIIIGGTGLFYFKKIVSYFDYYEYGEKKKNCGYARIIVKDHDMTLEVRLKGLPVKGAGTYELTSSGDQKRRLGQFSVEHGTGCFYACFHTMDLDGSGLSAFAVSGLSVPIDEDRSCETSWSWGLLPDIRLFERPFAETASAEEQPVKEDFAGAQPVEESSAGTQPVEEDFAGAQPVEESFAGAQPVGKASAGEQPIITAAEEQEEVGGVQDQAVSGRAETESRQEQAASGRAETLRQMEETPETEQGLFHKSQAENGSIQKDEEIPQQEILHEDKWQQLRALYPVCHPFGEHEDYIVIAPKDFIVLRREYQNLVSNSFLLHSFYNYHHIILGKMGGDGSGNYYIGVPGNYFEREKKVAVMFGFEGFAQSTRRNDKSAARKSEQTPVEPGAFGYYMKQVEI